MILQIMRFKDIKDGTLGKFKLLKDDKMLLSGYTLEPSGDDTTERNQDRRIPVGAYNVAWHNSPRFKQTLPLLYNDKVPKDRYILIHSGNYPEHTQGCILLGSSYDDKGVYGSRDMLLRFLVLVNKQELAVNIESKI